MEKAASYCLQKKYGRILFIDGVDILVKHNEKLCEVLITLAKILTDDNKIRLVPVSSKGSIMPQLETLSAANWPLVYEVEDIAKGDATKYFIEKGVTQVKAEKLVKLCRR